MIPISKYPNCDITLITWATVTGTDVFLAVVTCTDDRSVGSRLRMAWCVKMVWVCVPCSL